MSIAYFRQLSCSGEDELNLEDCYVRVMFLPPSVTPLIQPMDQNVIEAIEIQYRKSLV